MRRRNELPHRSRTTNSPHAVKTNVVLETETLKLLSAPASSAESRDAKRSNDDSWTVLKVQCLASS